ncbi:uncharacterized protein LOC142766970 isoform X3 [Rhipicephalus microplus]
MRRCLLHALFTFILLLALGASEGMVLNSYFCSEAPKTASGTDFCPVNSNSAGKCVKTPWNPKEGIEVKGPGILCVDHTLNPMVCEDQLPMELVGETTDDNEPIKYPLPASENSLYLVGYSKELNKSLYSCVATSFSQFGDNIIHRYLHLRKEGTKEQKWDEKIPLDIQARLCYITMNVTVT